MKPTKLAFLFITFIGLFLSCKKDSGDEGFDCEDFNKTTVTYTNDGTVPLRVTVATTLTSEFVPVNPVFTLNLEPGQSVEKEFEADEYFNVWESNCATNCSIVTRYKKEYFPCVEYNEKQGF